MNEESRDKRKVFEIISKNRLFFAIVGCVVAIVAFFVPMFHFDMYDMGFHHYGSLWIFGLYEYSFFTYIIEWFGVTEAGILGVGLISIVSTVIISALILGTIITASCTLIRRRKKGVYSSRFLLYFSIGLFVAVNAYTFAILVNLNTDLPWVTGLQHVIDRMGYILFVIVSVLILMGYTMKIKSLLKLLSLFVMGILITYAAINLAQFFVTIIYAASLGAPLNPEAVLFQFNFRGTPAVIALICALAIIIVNYILYKRDKKRAPIV